jgi:hypothetical protein
MFCDIRNPWLCPDNSIRSVRHRLVDKEALQVISPKPKSNNANGNAHRRAIE